MSSARGLNAETSRARSQISKQEAESSAKLVSLLHAIRYKEEQSGDEPRYEPDEQEAEQREAGLTPARYQV